MEDYCYKPIIKKKSPFTEMAIDVCVCICTRRCLITTQTQSDCSFLSISPTPPHRWNSLCINVITRNIHDSKYSAGILPFVNTRRSCSFLFCSQFSTQLSFSFALFPSLPQACCRSAITSSMILLIIFPTLRRFDFRTPRKRGLFGITPFWRNFCFQLCKTIYYPHFNNKRINCVKESLQTGSQL